MDNKELYDKILKVSEVIHKQALRGPANYIVCSPSVSEAMKHMDLLELRKDKIKKIMRRIKDKKYGKK